MADPFGYLANQKRGDGSYFDGVAWVHLPIGTSGQFLWVASGLPAWRTLAAGDLPAHGAAEHTDRTRNIANLLINGALQIRTGTPAWGVQGANTRYGAIAFDAASTEEILLDFVAPRDYVSSPQFLLHWTNLGAGAGDVVWEIIAAGVADGSDLNGTTESNTNDTITAPGAHNLKISTSTNNPPNLAAGRHCKVILGRLGAAAADTLANDCGLVAVEFIYTADS